MINLIRAELFKIRKEKYLLITVVGIIGFLCLVTFGISSQAVTLGIKNVLGTNVINLQLGSGVLTEILKSADVVVIFFLPIIISIFMVDFSVGTIKNNIISGFSRKNIYISKLIVSSIICILLVIVYAISAFLLVTLKNGYDNNLTLNLIQNSAKIIIIQMPLYIATITTAFMIGTITQSKSVVITMHLLYQIIVLMLCGLVKDSIPNIIKYEPISNLDKAANIGINSSSDNLMFILLGISIIVVTTIIGIVRNDRMDIQ